MRRELHVSDSLDLFASGVQIKSGPRWSWFSNDPSVLQTGKYYWIFAEIKYTDLDNSQEDMKMQEMQQQLSVLPLTYEQLMKPSFDYLHKMLSTL